MKRRDFIERATLAGVGAVFLPNCLSAQSDGGKKVRLASIGIGAMGLGDIQKLRNEHVVALCDVDSETWASGKKLYSSATCYRDFRVMLRDLKDDIDAVTISTPDHSHFPIAMMALKMGKHVYVQKPMAHTVWEVRQMMAEAKKQGVQTQMGNQGHAFEGIRLIREWYEAGLIGEVKEVIAWTNRPAVGGGFMAEQYEYPVQQPIPSNLDWDLWVGPVVNAPSYAAKTYHSRLWRGWWEFGVGGLGDIGCHTIDSPFWALDLEIPHRVDVKVDHVNPLYTPSGSIVSYQFRQKGTGREIPLTWYEGPSMPEKPKMLEEIQLSEKGGLMIIGSDGIIYHEGMRPDSPRLFPEEKWDDLRRNPASRPPKVYPRIKGNHIEEWLRSIKGTGSNPGSNFEYAGRLTESILLGSLAIRTGKGFDYNSEKMRILNNQEADDLLKIEARKGFRSQDLNS